jgi:hypothetical protein
MRPILLDSVEVLGRIAAGQGGRSRSQRTQKRTWAKTPSVGAAWKRTLHACRPKCGLHRMKRRCMLRAALDQSQTPDVLRSTIEALPSVFRACGRQLFSIQAVSREDLVAVCDVFHASFKIAQVPPHLLEGKAKRVKAFNRLNGEVPRETLAARAGERFCEIVQR